MKSHDLLTVFLFIAVVAILGAILIPNFIRARSQGRVTSCPSSLKNIGTALEMWETDHQKKFPARLDDLTPNYLKSIPTCPSVGRNTYSAGYAISPAADHYTLVCAGTNHAGVGLGPNFPQYTSRQGLIRQ